MDAGLEVLESGQIKSATVESLRFMNNKIVIIDDNLFGWGLYEIIKKFDWKLTENSFIPAHRCILGYMNNQNVIV